MPGSRNTGGGETKRVVRHTGCAAGGFPSPLGWEVRLSCFCATAGYGFEFVN